MIYAWKPRNVDDIDSESHALWLTTAPPADGSEGQCLPDNDLEENPNYSALLCKQYVDYVSKYPGVFESLAGVFEEDLPPPQPSDLGELPAATIAAVASLISVDSPKVSTYDSSGTAPHESPSHPSSVPPSAPNLGTSYADNRVCTYCGKVVDRPTRARDCRNRHLGLTPHKCQGRCGVVGCSASYGSEAVLLEHINLRRMQCPWCSKVISKKNKARHQKKYCPRRNLLSTSL